MVEIKFEGKVVEAIELDFDIGREDWAEYKLLDGGIIRVKNTVGRIFKIPGPPERWIVYSERFVVHREGI